MTNKLDHYIFEHGFVGHALVVFGVPNAEPILWNNEHNGWDFNMPSDTQILWTSMQVNDRSWGAITLMKQPNGKPRKLAIQTNDGRYPYFSRLGGSGPIKVDIGDRKYVRFWAEFKYIQCDPCPSDQEYSLFSTREKVEEIVITELTRRIKSEEILLSSLEILEYQ